MFYVGTRSRSYITASQDQIISIYSKIKEHYFYILEIEENGCIIYTI